MYMTLEAVKLENVYFKMGKNLILKDINLEINKSDFLAIIGPNGGGKSTLLKLILGLLKPNKGKVSVFGKSPPESRNLIGYLPQKVYFDPDFPINVFDTVLDGRYHGLFKKYTDNDREKVMEALRDVEMVDYEDRQINRLSGGQMQRVFLARALVREPKLLLLDEPMASIDPDMQNSFYELLSRLKKSMAIVIVSHDVGAVSSHVNSIACLNQSLYYHGAVEHADEGMEKLYKCPIDLITHGFPHRVLKKH